MTDSYQTIKETSIGEGFYSNKRSKFLAFAHHVETTDEISVILRNYKKRFYDARHCCYAYRIGTGDDMQFRFNDDGEPSSTAGKPIYGQIQSSKLTDILVCVVRYYGGINLGTGGLITAYKTAASLAIANSIIEERFIEERIIYTFAYPILNDVMRIIKEMNPKIINQQFDNTCEITLSIRQTKAHELRDRLNKLSFK